MIRIKDEHALLAVSGAAAIVLGFVFNSSITTIFSTVDAEITRHLSNSHFHFALVAYILVDWLTAIVLISVWDPPAKTAPVPLVALMILSLFVEGYAAVLAFDTTSSTAFFIFLGLLLLSVPYEISLFVFRSQPLHAVSFVGRLLSLAMLILAYVSWRLTGNFAGIFWVTIVIVIAKFLRVLFMDRRSQT